MNTSYIIICIILMALVTYLPRVIPLAFFRKKIEDGFFKSFLLYMPYGILGAMVFPEIFYSSPSLISAFAGTVVALIMAFCGKSLLPVTISSVLAVFITEQVMNIL